MRVERPVLSGGGTKCIRWGCNPGYEFYDGVCRTPASIQALEERRAKQTVARRLDLSRDSEHVVFYAGLALQRGYYGFNTDPQHAFDYFTRECDNGRSGACYGLGLLHIWPEGGVPSSPDPELGEQLLVSSCRAGYGAACSVFGDYHRILGEGADEAGRVAEFTFALNWYESACERGFGKGCRSAASLYEQDTILASPGQAYALHQRHCALSFDHDGRDSIAEACLSAARYAYNGVGELAPDSAEARRLVERARKLDEATAEASAISGCVLQGRARC
jgi:TPR repeat protein